MNRAELFVKRLWLFRFAHLLISFLVATVMVAVMLFQGYLLSLSGEFSGRLIKPEIPSDMLCRVLPGVRAPVVTDAVQQLRMSVWTVQVPAGRVEMAAVYSSAILQF